ncbi:hypothetical protein D9619_011814 [Psilocybe cf. subviscida]|uniref:PIH1 N-terminal domain-containing protein n=1 Tax=Psilocybe cf. subviscida TaxID=2480587 RepID=A0A8H5B0I3_9AGAR|nr:hypothetical protein D9619_011814 [Psilocybe cf. subviscida]
MSSSSSHVQIELAPKAGFCVKSSTLSAAVLPPPPQSAPKRSGNVLEPPPGPINVSKGQKVFINIAWDPKVPPPPEGSEDAIQKAMQGEDMDESNPSGWYVPVIVSQAREDFDKAGKPSLVFDCVYNSTVKTRTLHDPEFKTFLIELALQRIEAQTGFPLSRNIGTPNITSKGKLLPRTVRVPAALFPALTGAPSQAKQEKAPPLIEEVTDTASNAGASASADPLPGLRGILNKSSGTPTNGRQPAKAAVPPSGGDATGPLAWSWQKDDKGRLRVDVRVPGLTTFLIQQSTLDVEERRIILNVPGRPVLDIDVGLSDGEIVARTNIAFSAVLSSAASPVKKEALDSQKQDYMKQALQLKRQRDFDVDAADAEWKVGTGEVSIFV